MLDRAKAGGIALMANTMRSPDSCLAMHVHEDMPQMQRAQANELRLATCLRHSGTRLPMRARRDVLRDRGQGSLLKGVA